MTREVAFQDEVKHLLTGVTGTVVAIYEQGNKTYVDVRSSEYDRVFYKSPIENWTVVRTQEDIEGFTD